MERYLAHISDDNREQTVMEHLLGTAELCGNNASYFGAREQGLLAGYAHDIGKYSDAFQRRLAGGEKIDHATAGAYECMKAKQDHAAFAVIGHHGGLPKLGSKTAVGGGSLLARINKAKKGELPDYSKWKEELILPAASMPFRPQNAGERMFFIRMLFSCLTDADYLDTEAFMTGKERQKQYTDMETLWDRLEKYIGRWGDPDTALNIQRNKILEQCIEQGLSQRRGLFTLTVPTGGGKTIASLAFALAQAKTQGLRRVIYVVPYTSIIEQTADKFREILGDDVVLEHHCNAQFVIEDEANEDNISKMKATENWDMPVIVTTAVQFFQSLYGDKPFQCRKLHNISSSAIVFDEAQMLPLPYLRPCVKAISQLVEHYRATAVLCTATQPALGGIFQEFSPEMPIRDICSEDLCPTEVFRRTIFKRDANATDWEKMAERIKEDGQCLCVVNRRKSAKALYELIKGEGSYHLSTLMCPAHRRAVLNTIRERLLEDKPCRVISTSLIEAGVDLDLPRAYREEAGMDSILQTGGRCNREGKRPLEQSIVTVFRTDEKPPKDFEKAISSGRYVFKRFEDVAGREAVHTYFEQLFDLKKDALDKKNIIAMTENGSYDFPEIAKQFKLIENDNRTVYVPWDETGMSLVERLRSGEKNRELFRRLGQYSVSIYEQHFNSLDEAGALELLEDGSAILLDMEKYDEATGLSMDTEGGQAIIL